MEFFNLLKNKRYFLHLSAALGIAAVSLVLWFYFTIIVEALPAQPNYDLLLSILPNIQHTALGWFYIVGFVSTILLMLVVTMIKDPKKLPYVIFVIGMCTLIRDFLFSMTVMDAPDGRASKLTFLEFDRDLFPSGHSGIPFVMGLLTDIKWLKYFLFAMSAIIGAIVLLTRIHYSIDVFGGYFIFYGMYSLFDKYLKKWFGTY